MRLSHTAAGERPSGLGLGVAESEWVLTEVLVWASLSVWGPELR